MFLHLTFWHSLTEVDAIQVLALDGQRVPDWIYPEMDERGAKLAQAALDI